MLKTLGSFVLGTVTFVFVCFAGVLIYIHIPEKSCYVQWYDSAHKRIDEAIPGCPATLETTKVGDENYARIKGAVYVVRIADTEEPARLVQCMIGVACLPIPSRARESKRIEFTRLDGDVDIDKLRTLNASGYISDGHSVFYGFERVAATMPPIDIGSLRLLECPKFDDPEASWERTCTSYATDGRYVLLGAKILEGADATSFKADVAILDARGRHLDPAPFGRDRHAVYAGAVHIKGADPETFGVVSADSTFASDQRHAWKMHFDEFEELNLSPSALADLRRSLAAAQAARAARQSNQ